ncbi:MAG: HEAT repeat domain-containing protein [Deltaproteobacteria bacterium]|nr:HEAT repeat domain-containing protein [Deltaproteobacteria bacterium]
MPEAEKAFWYPACIDTVEAVLEKFKAGDDRETAMAFCRLVAERADENWSSRTIARLVHYACSHPDLEPGKLNLHCDKNSDEATVEILFQNTINCVRGVAAGAIGQLLWERKDRLEQVRPGIEALIQDPHPAVRMAAIEAIEPVLNIDRDLAVHWFCEACKNDLRVAASPRALNFYNYTVPSHIDQVGPIVQQMVFSPLDDVALQGARQVTARWLFHSFFEKEFSECLQGSIPQRKGVANVAAALLQDKKYSRQCQDLLRQFMNDSEKEVRDELRGMFRNKDLISDPEYAAFIKEYIESQAFADDPDHFVWSLKDLAGSLIPVADAIFTVCEEFSTTLQEKTRDIGSRYPRMASEMSSILLRLYEQAQGERNRQIADRCLDIWDLFFENRVGRTMELTKAIEQ